MMQTVSNAFNDHPQRNNQSYFAHLCQAMVFSLLSLIASFTFLVHAIFPFVFQTEGGDVIQNIARDITTIREKHLKRPAEEKHE
jgi:hypothetical protein